MEAARPKQNYRRYVENQVRQDRMKSPWEEVKERILLGAADFIDELKKSAREALGREKTPAWLRERVPLEKIIGQSNKSKETLGRVQRALRRRRTGLDCRAGPLGEWIDTQRTSRPTRLQTPRQYQHEDATLPPTNSQRPAEGALAQRAAKMLNVAI